MAKKYNILLFDIDDTLIDFAAVEKNSLKKVFFENKTELTDNILSTYKSINNKLWRMYERGEKRLSDILTERFYKTFEIFGINADGAAFNKRFLELLGENTIAVRGAAEVLNAVYGKYKIYAVTNGIADVQKKRLKNVDFYKYFDCLFCSGDVGFQKPSMEYYSYVLSHIDEFEREKALIIGDSPSTDLAGGVMLGIDACWYNPSGKTCDIYHKWEIKSIKELLDILET